MKGKPVVTRSSAINSSASHVFEVLRLVSAAKEPTGVSDIARSLSLPASTVYRALITLEESEYINRFQSSPRYELGPVPRLLNRALLRRFALQRHVAPMLRRLADETGETASVCARLGWYSLRISVAYGSQDFYHRDRLGEVSPLHTTSPSKAILAGLISEDVARYWRFAAKHFGTTPNAHKQTEAALTAARRDGYVAEPMRFSPGHSAVAMPLRDHAGQVIAALTLHGPVGDSGTGVAPPAGVAMHKAIEAIIAATPARYMSPFAHIDPDDLFIALPPTPHDGATD